MSALRSPTGLAEAAGADATVDPTVDPRIAATGGRRRIFGDPKSCYTWPGMTDAVAWARSDVHKHTSYYGCAWCGQGFRSPNAVYTHIDKVHPR
jgi:hypothetical protein